MSKNVNNNNGDNPSNSVDQLDLKARNSEQLKKDHKLAFAALHFLYTKDLAGSKVEAHQMDTRWDNLLAIEAELNLRRIKMTSEERELRTQAGRMLFQMRYRQPGDHLKENKSLSNTITNSAKSPYPASFIKEKVVKFNGDFFQFAAFRLTFDSLVHFNPYYDDNRRQIILVNAVKEEAYKVIWPFIGQPNGYQLMYQHLMDTYTQPDNVKYYLTRELENLPKMSGPADARLDDFKRTLVLIKAAIDNLIGSKDHFGYTVYKLIISKFNKGNFATEQLKNCNGLDQMIATLQGWITVNLDQI